MEVVDLEREAKPYGEGASLVIVKSNLTYLC
jgi:hypothetical protein